MGGWTDDGSVSISVKGESETPLGAASLDEEIIENGCKTQDIVKLKLSNKIGSISVAMNRVNKVPNLKAELELQSMPSKTTVESQNIDVGADEIQKYSSFQFGVSYYNFQTCDSTHCFSYAPIRK